MKVFTKIKDKDVCVCVYPEMDWWTFTKTAGTYLFLVTFKCLLSVPVITIKLALSFISMGRWVIIKKNKFGTIYITKYTNYHTLWSRGCPDLQLFRVTKPSSRSASFKAAAERTRAGLKKIKSRFDCEAEFGLKELSELIKAALHSSSTWHCCHWQKQQLWIFNTRLSPDPFLSCGHS